MNKVYFIILLSFFSLWFWQCQEPNTAPSGYLNHNDTVEYVGIETCKQCHLEKYESFIKTGMGQSFGIADVHKSAADFEGKSVYDPFLDFEYFPYWRNDGLFVGEYRRIGDEIVYNRTEKADYIVGSGQHTNSHIFVENGYTHQLPFTYYTQSGKLDLPPGFEDGNNSRFSRKIGLECMSCHNAMPVNFVKGSENKFNKIPLGIDCERCHGPGEAHVNKINAGDITDVKEIDYSIVNPGKLSAQLQFEICQRCHLQGNSVLKEGMSFFDFKPGMVLSDVMDVYLPRYNNSDEEFIMASHIDRFKLSECFKQSNEQFVCTSCHDPHVSVKETGFDVYNSTCNKCHTTNKKQCSLPMGERELEGNNCVKCHMPRSGSIDIPHVSTHDHFIRKPVNTSEIERVKTFIKLQAINNDNPTLQSRIKGYLQQYERFESNPTYLDSAFILLRKSDAEGDFLFREWILFYHLKQEPENMVRFVNDRLSTSALKRLNKESYENEDAWAAYRIGEAYYAIGSVENAIVYYERSVQLAPFQLEFRNKLGSAYSLNQQYDLAKQAYKYVLNEYPKSPETLSNLGYLYILEEDYVKAEELIDKSLDLDPDYTQAKLNLASLYIASGRSAKALYLLKNILIDNPGNTKVISAIAYLESLL